MSNRDFDQRSDESFEPTEEEFDEEKWDREHFEHWMDTVRANEKDPDESYGSLGGTPYEGGVYTSASYGSGAEYYDITGMNPNPLLEKKHGPHFWRRAKAYVIRSDERIRNEVCERLTQHPLIDATMLDVHVNDGDVSLTGEVLDRRMMQMVEDVVDEVHGVKEIHNRLRVITDRAA
jgi:hypothetical protein